MRLGSFAGEVSHQTLQPPLISSPSPSAPPSPQSITAIPPFYRPLWRAGLDLTLSLSDSVTKTQMSYLETSDADGAQSKDVWNENLEFLRSSADCLLSADCLQNPNEPFRDF